MRTLKDFNPADLQDLETINAICLRQHVMPPAVLKLKCEVIMGGEVTDLYQDLARSWVRNNYNFMTMQQFGLMFGTLGTAYGAGTVVAKRTNGTTDNSTAWTLSHRNYGSGYHCRGAAGVTAHGVVVGTGTTAEDFEHHALATLIASGSGAGQMDYAAMDALTAVWDAGTRKFTQTLVRNINNNSGGSITVNEVGLICRLYLIEASTATNDYLLARDLLSPGVAVPNTAQLKVTYTIESATYPV